MCILIRNISNKNMCLPNWHQSVRVPRSPMYLHCMCISAALHCSPMPVFCSTAPKIAQHVNVPFSIFEMITVGISRGNKTEIENSGTVLKPSAKWKRWQLFIFLPDVSSIVWTTHSALQHGRSCKSLCWFPAAEEPGILKAFSYWSVWVLGSRKSAEMTRDRKILPPWWFCQRNWECSPL